MVHGNVNFYLYAISKIKAQGLEKQRKTRGFIHFRDFVLRDFFLIDEVYFTGCSNKKKYEHYFQT